MAQTITNNEKTQSSLNTSLQSQIDAQASANIKNQTELNNATTSLAAIKSTQQTQSHNDKRTVSAADEFDSSGRRPVSRAAGAEENGC